MSRNTETIIKFYKAFQDKNPQSMIECYSDDIEFYDPAFQNLKGIEAKAMWQMLIERAADLKLNFTNVQADENKGSADWVAEYPFSKTGRKIVNRIHAEFIFKDGKIIRHTDSFNLWKWSGMALGPIGYLLGFTPFIQNQIRKEARTGLELYMKRKRLKEN